MTNDPAAFLPLTHTLFLCCWADSFHDNHKVCPCYPLCFFSLNVYCLYLFPPKSLGHNNFISLHAGDCYRWCQSCVSDAHWLSRGLLSVQTDMKHSEPQQALISIPLVVSLYFVGMDCRGYVGKE